MKEYLQQQKNLIEKYLEDFFQELNKDTLLSSKKHSSALARLCRFTTKGKMLRGGLVFLGYNLFKEGHNRDLLRCATALELMQSALLIHDDIMDLDTLRRGETTLYQQYVAESKEKNRRDAQHIGESLGICVGDLAFFTAYEILADLELEASVKGRVLRLFSREMSLVGLAQMDDVAWGAESGMISEEEILSLYRHKTGRYTYSLPLAIGAIVSGQSDGIVQKLMELGQNLGILFQIKDDELGLVGNEKDLGKPVGSDIMEGKKTLHYHLLLEHCTPEEKRMLQGIYGRSDASLEDIIQVQNLVKTRNICEKMDRKMLPLVRETEKQMEELLPENTSMKPVLSSLLEYNRGRRN